MTHAQQMVGGDVTQLLGEILERLRMMSPFPIHAGRKEVLRFNLFFQELRGERGMIKPPGRGEKRREMEGESEMGEGEE